MLGFKPVERGIHSRAERDRKKNEREQRLQIMYEKVREIVREREREKNRERERCAKYASSSSERKVKA